MSQGRIPTGRGTGEQTARGEETGYAYTRRFAQERGPVQLREAPATTQEGPRVMFQGIVRDGLLGTEFLNRFVQTFEVPNNRLVLRAPRLSL